MYILILRESGLAPNQKPKVIQVFQNLSHSSNQSKLTFLRMEQNAIEMYKNGGLCQNFGTHCSGKSLLVLLISIHLFIYLFASHKVFNFQMRSTPKYKRMECFKCIFGICLKCTQSCQLCILSGSAGSNCSLCQSGTYLVNGNCKACGSGCANCIDSANNCTQCKASAYFYNGSCVNCFTVIPFCLTCVTNNSQVVCISCSPSMVVVRNTCRQCPQGCLVCINETSCTFSMNSYFISNQTCIKCDVQNCVVCTQLGKCQHCTLGYFNQGIDKNCPPCPLNCLNCLSTTKCIQCSDFFYEYQGLCFSCPNNCQICVHLGTNCLTCAPGFYQPLYSISICIPCPIYCIQCYNPYYCYQCSNGTYLLNTICYPCSVSNCYDCKYETQNQTDVCLSCLQGYFIVYETQQCVPCAVNCSICTSMSVCSVCRDGFHLLNNSCVACLANCRACTSTDVCLECAVEFLLIMNNTICADCPIGCIHCLSLAYCTQCLSGFYLYSTNEYQICESCVQPCLMCSSASNCTLCGPRSAINFQGICQSCDTGCITCFYKAELMLSCEMCDKGYALVYSQDSKYLSCAQCPQNCSQCKLVLNHHSFTSFVVCTNCPEGWTMSLDGSCFQCGSSAQTVGCMECNAQAQCISCYPQYILNSSTSQCSNNNYVTKYSSEWPYIGASIGLGFLTMALIIVLLVMRLDQPSNRSSIDVNTSQLTN